MRSRELSFEGLRAHFPMPPNNFSRNHHYLPVFYTKQWAGPDGRLCEFSRPYDRVKPRMTHPTGAGYERDLYHVPGLSPANQYGVEDKFMKKVDQLACDALQILLHGDGSEFTIETKSGWARFILSLLQRNPEKTAWAKAQWKNAYDLRMVQVEEQYDELRTPSAPRTYAELRAKMDGLGYEKSSAIFLQQIIDMPNAGAHINNMRWSILTIDKPGFTFLTSDRPVVMSNGIKYPDSYIILPIGPRRMFLSVNTPEAEQQFHELALHKLVRAVNDKVVLQAQKYVYDTNDRQLRFVENRPGRGTPQLIVSNPEPVLPTI
jgi:hypothetical protein